jgi:prepilin-type processing-associated H-X9-DG protein
MLDDATPASNSWLKRWGPGRLILIGLVCVVGLPLLGLGILMPNLCRSRETANRVKCASNERQIGQAIELYAKEHGGKFPDTLADLLLTQDMTAEVFVCPSSNGEKALGNTVEEQAKNLVAPKSLSYIYLGKGLTTAAAADTPVLYEDLMDHDDDGANVLFADGHVEWNSRKGLPAIIPSIAVPEKGR